MLWDLVHNFFLSFLLHYTLITENYNFINQIIYKTNILKIYKTYIFIKHKIIKFPFYLKKTLLVAINRTKTILTIPNI